MFWDIVLACVAGICFSFGICLIIILAIRAQRDDDDEFY